MITRSDYMQGLVTFQAYYVQYVSAAIFETVRNSIGSDRLVKASEDLNAIPLSEWDNLDFVVSRDILNQCGETWSLATKVCIAKAAARCIIVFDSE